MKNISMPYISILLSRSNGECQLFWSTYDCKLFIYSSLMYIYITGQLRQHGNLAVPARFPGLSRAPSWSSYPIPSGRSRCPTPSFTQHVPTSNSSTPSHPLGTPHCTPILSPRFKQINVNWAHVTICFKTIQRVSRLGSLFSGLQRQIFHC